MIGQTLVITNFSNGTKGCMIISANICIGAFDFENESKLCEFIGKRTLELSKRGYEIEVISFERFRKDVEEGKRTF